MTEPSEGYRAEQPEGRREPRAPTTSVSKAMLQVLLTGDDDLRRAQR
jgi:hypothetical protein